MSTGGPGYDFDMINAKIQQADSLNGIISLNKEVHDLKLKMAELQDCNYNYSGMVVDDLNKIRLNYWQTRRRMNTCIMISIVTCLISIISLIYFYEVIL